jgi:hypothetical protein
VLDCGEEVLMALKPGGWIQLIEARNQGPRMCDRHGPAMRAARGSQGLGLNNVIDTVLAW